MASKVLSIEIGVNTTRLCLVDYRVKTPKVYKYARLATPEGTIRDGELAPTPEFVTAVKHTIASNRMKCKQAIFTIASSKIAAREVSIPIVKEKKIDALVRANASDYFPIDLSDYEIGYILMGKTTGVAKPGQETPPQMYRLQVMAAPKSMLDTYRTFASACGMQMVATDYSGNSVYQMAKGVATEGVQMVVKVDERSSIITVLKDGSITLQRSAVYGIDEATQTIMENPAFGVSDYEDAVSLAVRKTCMKYTFSPDSTVQQQTDGDEPMEDADDPSLTEAKYRVSASLRSLAGNIGRIMEYYSSRNGGERIEKIYLTGIGADFGGFTRLLTNELGVETVGLQHLEGFHLDRVFKEGHCGEYLTCIGAAIAPVGFISNTKSGKSSEKTASGRHTWLAVLFLLGGIAVGAGMIIVSFLNYQSEQTRYMNDVSRLNELSEIRQIYAQYTATETAYTEVQKIYYLTENHNEDLVAFIEELEEKMPADIVVSTFSASTESVSMSIEVSSKEEMANALQQLRSFNSVETITVGGATENIDDNGLSTVSFSVTVVYKTMEQMRAEQANE